MSGITTHVVDTAAGRPAEGMPVRLELQVKGRGWVTLAERVTGPDGQVSDLLPVGGRLDAGVYRLTFQTAAYFMSREQRTFFPEAVVVFEVRDPSRHYHVPLLLSPFAYSTHLGEWTV